jgi:cell division protein ZapA (FtsZ GTPase activity inhibitor)
VDDRIHEIRVAAGLIEGHKAAILAALSIADEYFQAQEEAGRARAELAARIDRLAEKLEGALAD